MSCIFEQIVSPELKLCPERATPAFSLLWEETCGCASGIVARGWHEWLNSPLRKGVVGADVGIDTAPGRVQSSTWMKKFTWSRTNKEGRKQGSIHKKLQAPSPFPCLGPPSHYSKFSPSSLSPHLTQTHTCIPIWVLITQNIWLWKILTYKAIQTGTLECNVHYPNYDCFSSSA